MLISLYQAGRRLGLGKQTMLSIAQVDKNRPDYVIPQNDGSYKVDDDHPEFARLEQKFILEGDHDENGTLKRGRPKKDSQNENRISKTSMESSGNKNDTEEIDPDNLSGLSLLRYKAIIGELNKKIYAAEKIEEEAKQEKIKTLALQKELIPTSLMKHIFSFGDRIIQRLYRRPYEIMPQLEAYILSKESDKAIEFLLKELESIIIDVKTEIMEDVKKDGLQRFIK